MKFIDVFKESSLVSPSVLEDMNKELLRKHAQLDKLSEEVRYIANSSVLELENTVEGISQLKAIEKAGGVNAVNSLVIQRKLNELPPKMYNHITNALTAQEFEKNIAELKQQLSDVGVLINSAYDGKGGFTISEKSKT